MIKKKIGNCIGGVLTLIVVDGWFYPQSGKTIKLVFVASLLTTVDYGERTKTGWLRIKIMCQSGTTCLPTDCCFSDMAI